MLKIKQYNIFFITVNYIISNSEMRKQRAKWQICKMIEKGMTFEEKRSSSTFKGAIYKIRKRPETKVVVCVRWTARLHVQGSGLHPNTTHAPPFPWRSKSRLPPPPAWAGTPFSASNPPPPSPPLLSSSLPFGGKKTFSGVGRRQDWRFVSWWRRRSWAQRWWRIGARRLWRVRSPLPGWRRSSPGRDQSG